ncbi:MAG: ERF family protein, partial [Betaproteobacteria bacterium]|nr:ERF family protein [Betaproteobacteria bacterium]
MEQPNKQIAAALVKAQRNFSPALKTNTNHFNSRYADLASCVEAVIDALNGAGIALVQMTSKSETGVTVETVFIHESGEAFRAGELHIPANRMDAQGFGSALTYARRYSLMAACGIAPEDDDGNAAVKTQRQEEPEGMKPKAPEGMKPKAPEGMKPKAPEGMKPKAPEGMKPKAP